MIEMLWNQICIALEILEVIWLDFLFAFEVNVQWLQYGLIYQMLSASVRGRKKKKKKKQDQASLLICMTVLISLR